MLLYTYISRFSVNPHYQQKRNIRQSCRHKFYPQPLFIVFFNFLHKRPTFAFTSESGYTHSALGERSHTAAHTPKQGCFGRGWYHYPRTVPHVLETLRGQMSERQTLPLLGLGRVCSQRTQNACGTAMRLCGSLSRGVAAPLGCVIFFASAEIAVCTSCAQGFLRVRGEGWYHCPCALCALLKRSAPACQND